MYSTFYSRYWFMWANLYTLHGCASTCCSVMLLSILFFKNLVFILKLKTLYKSQKQICFDFAIFNVVLYILITFTTFNNTKYIYMVLEFLAGRHENFRNRLHLMKVFIYMFFFSSLAYSLEPNYICIWLVYITC